MKLLSATVNYLNIEALRNIQYAGARPSTVHNSAMSQRRFPSLAIDAGLLYSAAVWGATFPIVKDSLKGIGALALVGHRFLLAALVLGLVLWAKRVPIKPVLRQGMALGAILWLLYASQTIGLNYTSAANSGFITGLFVVFVPVFSLLLFRKPPTWIRWLAVGLAIVGLWLLTGGMSSFNRGDGLTLIAAATYALHILFADKWVQGEIDPYALSFVQFATVALLSFAAVPVFGESYAVGSGRTALVVLGLALFPTLSAFVIQLVAQKTTAPVKVALIFTMEPVFAALFSWTLGNEKPAALQAAGGALIVVAMVLSEVPVRQRLTSESG